MDKEKLETKVEATIDYQYESSRCYGCKGYGSNQDRLCPDDCVLDYKKREGLNENNNSGNK